MNVLKSTQEPSDFIYFDRISEENMKTILTHDYDVQLEKDYCILVEALENCSYQSIFDKFISRIPSNHSQNQISAGA